VSIIETLTYHFERSREESLRGGAGEAAVTREERE
jgi:hypothetical protein